LKWGKIISLAAIDEEAMNHLRMQPIEARINIVEGVGIFELSYFIIF
jgi:hypothetical protein